MELLKEISKYLQEGDCDGVEEMTEKAIDEGFEPQKILNEGLIEGMNIIGEKYREHIIFLPDVLLSAKAMYAGLDRLKPLFLKGDIQRMDTVVIGTVQGDLHDIGKNLVGIMLKGAGFEVIDLGNNVPPDAFIDAAENENAGIIGMSALLTTTMSVMREVIRKIEERGLKKKLKTIIGGAPVSEEFAEEIGADAYGSNSYEAVRKVKKLLGVN